MNHKFSLFNQNRNGVFATTLDLAGQAGRNLADTVRARPVLSSVVAGGLLSLGLISWPGEKEKENQVVPVATRAAGAKWATLKGGESQTELEPGLRMGYFTATDSEDQIHDGVDSSLVAEKKTPTAQAGVVGKTKSSLKTKKSVSKNWKPGKKKVAPKKIAKAQSQKNTIAAKTSGESQNQTGDDTLVVVHKDANWGQVSAKKPKQYYLKKKPVYTMAAGKGGKDLAIPHMFRVVKKAKKVTKLPKFKNSYLTKEFLKIKE